MTTINNALRDYAAARNFLDTQPADAPARGFGDLDSTAHAIIDQADLAADGKTIYGADIPDLMPELPEEIVIPTGPQPMA